MVCGHSHTLAIDQDGVVYSWGQQKYGALGLGPEQPEIDLNSPKVISTLLPEAIIDISAGNRHSVFISKYSKVFGCGEAKRGQLG